MDRRRFILNSVIATLTASQLLKAQAQHMIPGNLKNIIPEKKTIAFFIYPGITVLDLIGPATVLDNGSFNIEYVFHDKRPVETETEGLKIYPTITFDELPNPDIVCVPGTGNPFDVICDMPALKWLNNAGEKAEYVTSVCSGSIILAAAGLMKGYRAATHWSMEEQLRSFGVTTVDQRVVIDRNRITGGGVTAGIDFGLTLLSIIKNEDEAKLAQLMMQYDPHPPFKAGTPTGAGSDITAKARKQIFDNIERETPAYRDNLLASQKYVFNKLF